MAFATGPLHQRLSFEVVCSDEPLLTPRREEFNEARQNRILNHAEAYLGFRGPKMLTTSLRGPLTDAWARSWNPEDLNERKIVERPKPKLRMRLQTTPKKLSKRLRTTRMESKGTMTTPVAAHRQVRNSPVPVQHVEPPQILKCADQLQPAVVEPCLNTILKPNETSEFEYRQIRQRPRRVIFGTPRQVTKHARTAPGRGNPGSLRTYFTRVSASAAKRGSSRLSPDSAGSKHHPGGAELHIGRFDVTGQISQPSQEIVAVAEDEGAASESRDSLVSPAGDSTQTALLQAARDLQSELDSPGSDSARDVQNIPDESAQVCHYKSLRDLSAAAMSTQELLDAPPDFSLCSDHHTPRAETFVRSLAPMFTDSGPLNTSELSIPRMTLTESSLGIWPASSPAPGSSRVASIDVRNHVDIQGALDSADAFLSGWHMESGAGSSQVSVHG